MYVRAIAGLELASLKFPYTVFCCFNTTKTMGWVCTFANLCDILFVGLTFRNYLRRFAPQKKKKILQWLLGKRENAQKSMVISRAVHAEKHNRLSVVQTGQHSLYIVNGTFDHTQERWYSTDGIFFSKTEESKC